MAPAEGEGGGMSTLIMFGLIIVVMYFFMIRPQSKKAKELNKFRAGLDKGDKVIIMNGYQCYLKRMSRTIPMEVKASQVFGFNLGIKLIRGAYMMEEREIAQ